MPESYKKLHDLLLAGKPEGADHDKDKCPICTGEREIASQEGNVTDEAIFTTEQHEQLLSAAVESAKAEATTDADAEVLSLNEQLKLAEEKTEAAETKVTETETKVTELESSNSDRDEAERLSELADERAELVKAAVNFTDEQIEARKESWAKKDDEEFEALVEDYKAAAEAATSKSDEKKKTPVSKFDGIRVTAGDDTGPESVKAFFDSGLTAV